MKASFWELLGQIFFFLILLPAMVDLYFIRLFTYYIFGGLNSWPITIFQIKFFCTMSILMNSITASNHLIAFEANPRLDHSFLVSCRPFLKRLPVLLLCSPLLRFVSRKISSCPAHFRRLRALLFFLREKRNKKRKTGI